MKRIITTCLLVVIMALTAVIAACGGPAQETPDMVTVTITLPDGVSYDGYRKEQSVEKGAAITLPEDDDLTSIPESKEVDGWYIDSDKLSSKSVTVTKNTEITLKLKDKVVAPVMVTVTITLPNGVSYDGYQHEQSVEKGDTITLPANDKLTGIPEGKEVDGWYIGDKKVEGNTITVNENTEITLKLKDKPATPVMVTVTITLPSGVSYDGYQHEQSVEKGDTITLPANDKLTGIPEGKEVDGWYIGAEKINGNTVTINENTEITLKLKDKVVAPVMVTVTITLPSGVSYDGYQKEQSIEKGDTITLPANDKLTGIPADKEVDGWYIDGKKVEGTTVTINENTEITLELKDKVVAPVMFTVTITLPSGVSYPGYEHEMSVQTGTAINLPENDELTGIPADKEVDGWYIGGEKISGNTVTINEDTEITLVLKDKQPSNQVTVTLVDALLDGSTQIKIEKGGVLDLSEAEFSARRETTYLRYWYNAADPSQIIEVEDASAITVEGDITLAPAFDLNEELYANRDGSTQGKLATYPYYGAADMIEDSQVQPADGYIRANDESGEQAIDPYWGYVGTGADREMGAIFHWRGVDGAALPNGFYFTPLSPYKVTSGYTYVMTYTIQNRGDKTITLKIYQINSGSSPKSGVSTDEFVLAPGEVKELKLEFSYGNNNILTTVELLTDGITDLEIGMYQYIELPKTLHALTVQGGTVDGQAAVKQVAFNTVVTPVAETKEGREAYVWYNTENPEETFGKNFIMPDRDLTIAPRYDGIYADVGSNTESGTTGKVAIYPDGGLWRKTPAGFNCSASLQHITETDRWAVYDMTKSDGSAIKNGDYAMFQSKYGYQKTNVYSTTFTVKNLGKEAVSLQFYITGSGSAWEKGVTDSNTAKADTVLTLQPGETGTVDIDFNLNSNSNEMVVFQYVGKAELTSLNLAMYQYITNIAPAE